MFLSLSLSIHVFMYMLREQHNLDVLPRVKEQTPSIAFLAQIWTDVLM